MQTISLNAIAAAQTVAQTIEGFGDPDGITVVSGENTALIRPCGEWCDHVEVRLGGSANVSIDRPAKGALNGNVIPASVRWSSSDSNGSLEDAKATVELLAFATQVADQLNEWADRGELPRLLPPAERATAETHGATDPDLFVGDDVVLTVERAGRPGQTAGKLYGRVLNVGAEVDVEIPLSESAEVEMVLQRSGFDGDVNDLVETLDGREAIVLRNNQRETVAPAD
jgi:hypothetical protein